MNKVYLDKNIFYIDNFISKEDLEKFLILMKDPNEVDFSIQGTPSQISVVFRYDSTASKIWYNNYCEKITSLIDDDEYFDIKNPFALIKYKTSAVYLDEFVYKEDPDWLMIPHHDEYESCTTCLNKGLRECENECREKQTKLTKGFVIYFTEDFDGGEIEYVNKDITIKPKAGRLVMHPGNDEYSHGVRRFYNGDRIIFSGFIHKKK